MKSYRSLAAAAAVICLGVSLGGCLTTEVANAPLPDGRVRHVTFFTSTQGFISHSIALVDDCGTRDVPTVQTRGLVPISPKDHQIRMERREVGSHPETRCEHDIYANGGTNSGVVNGFVAPVTQAAVFGGAAIVAARATPGTNVAVSTTNNASAVAAPLNILTQNNDQKTFVHQFQQQQ